MTEYIKREGAPDVAYVYSQGHGDGKALPAVVFCGGYRSDMQGTKAVFLEAQCRAEGRAFLRFDYRGHGLSKGMFEDCVISQWADDARDSITACVQGDFILVGSSMGGWISFLLARDPAFERRLRGIVGIAAAPDFVDDMFARRLSKAEQSQLLEQGVVYLETAYDDTPLPFTRAFYEDGVRSRVLDNPAPLPCPVHLLQGTEDADVPWQRAIEIRDAFGLPESAIELIDGGDHRLSSPDQLQRLWAAVRGVPG